MVLILLASCAKQAPLPPVVEATPKPAKSDHPLVIAANKMGIPVPEGEIIEMTPDRNLPHLRHAYVGNLQGIYNTETMSTYGVRDPNALAEARRLAKAGQLGPDLTSEQYEAAARQVIKRWKGSDLGPSWRVERIVGLSGREAHEGTVTVIFENVQNGYVLGAGNVASAVLRRDTGSFAGVMYKETRTGATPNIRVSRVEAATLARNHVTSKGIQVLSTETRGPSYGLPYACDSQTALLLAEVNRTKILPLAYTVFVETADGATWDVLVDSETGTYMGEVRGPK